jgi:hypothetical protein
MSAMSPGGLMRALDSRSEKFGLSASPKQLNDKLFARDFDWDEKSILLISLFETKPAREREPES